MARRTPVQGHSDVSSTGGSLYIPSKELPSYWTSAPDPHHLLGLLDRGFVFPGEQINLLVTVTSDDLSLEDDTTSRKGEAEANQEPAATSDDGNETGIEGVEESGELATEEKRAKERSAELLKSFSNSHFYVKIVGSDEDKIENELEESEKDKAVERAVPVVMERDGFDPVGAGGIARRAVASCSLSNGDVVVVLQVTVAALTNSDDAFLEVLQYEQHNSPMSASKNVPKDLDPAQDLLHWLLPLDRNTFLPPQQPAPAPSAPSVSATQRLSFGSSNSTLFSFGHLRSSSQGSLPPVVPSGAVAPVLPYPPSPLNTPPGDWNRLYPEKDFGSQDMGDEGLMSFRGVPLEPQRFTVHCGLEGLYVPGKRWYRKISIVQPLAVTSYFADCNAEDLICVLVENVLPPHLSDVLIFIDSVSIICQAAGTGCHPQPVSVASIEIGEDEKLPNLSLRFGEQYSFILRPTLSLLNFESFKQPVSPKEASEYAVLISCHSSHSQSRFYMKHSLKWKPRPPRDLLVSVLLENSTPTVVPNEALPQLKSQVTNLTSKDLDLTLLAPSSMPCSPVSVVALPTRSCTRPRVGNSQSFRPGMESKIKTNARSMSLPSGRETVKVPESIEDEAESPPKKPRERKLSAADIVAENSPARTHLWLQSTVPLGCIPAHSTTVVKCDLLPLTDGIISLDTLHLATKDLGTLFIPENSLHIHSTSGITTGS